MAFTLTEATVDFAGAGNNTVIAAVAGKQIRVFRLWFVVAGATDILFRDGTALNLCGALALLANGSVVFDLTQNSQFDAVAWFTLTAGNAFVINSSNAVQVSGRVYYECMAEGFS